MKKMSTPWGEAQTVKEWAPGIVEVSTASHGGFYISPIHMEKMIKWPSPFLKNEWYEEDCDASYVFASFPELFGEELAERARKMITQMELA